MLDFLFWISAKKVVVACATIGALLVLLAPKLGHGFRPVKRESSPTMEKGNTRAKKMLVVIGYMFVGLSITLFIIAGFIVDLG